MNRNNMFGHYNEAPLLRTVAPSKIEFMDHTKPVRDSLTALPPVPGQPVLIVPPIGDVWAGQGGIYAGLSLTDDGLHACHLILADTDRTLELNHKDTGDWAAALSFDGHKDFTLPNRVDGIVLYQRLRDQFSLDEWHWLSETHASDSDFAWCQSFDYGSQGIYHKSNKLRARAVRRLVIQ